MTRYTPTYSSWQCMKQRCYNTNKDSFKNYGGRGITVCDRWLNSFETFLEDMGERPEGMTLDRINSNLNYEPSNCRWATRSEQNLSQRFDCHYGAQSATPHICKHRNSFRLSITITTNNMYRIVLPSLAEAEALRDICAFERDFLKLRGLTYD